MSWRKRFQLQVTPSDKQLMAIGLVVAQWSIIENHLTMIAHGIYGDNDEAKAEFNKLQNFRKRFDKVRDLIDRQIVEPHRSALLAHLNRIGSVVVERDKIVHGLWGSDDPAPEDPSVDQHATHAFNWTKPKPRFNWQLSYDRILQTALKIDRLAFELMDYLVKADGYPQQSLMSTVLQKMRRNPTSESK